MTTSVEIPNICVNCTEDEYYIHENGECNTIACDHAYVIADKSKICVNPCKDD